MENRRISLQNKKPTKMETTNVIGEMAENLQNKFNQPKPFHPSQFNDPIAIQTKWTGAVSGGANFRTFKLVQVNPGRVVFRTTFGAVVFALIFLFAGLGLVVLIIWDATLSAFTTEAFVAIGLGSIFLCLGSYLLYRQMLPIVFDKREGLFWKKRKKTTGMSVDDATENGVHLEHIHALQIVAEFISGKNGNYYSFELNLVLKNGKRINVVDHGNKTKIDKDAKLLSEFLNIPVWDATV